MHSLAADDALAVEAVAAIHAGDVATLRRLSTGHPELVTVGLGGDVDQLGGGGMTRSLLHVATDWPGQFPNVAATIEALAAAGAHVDARSTRPHNETPLHWAASSDDADPGLHRHHPDSSDLNNGDGLPHPTGSPPTTASGSSLRPARPSEARTATLHADDDDDGASDRGGHRLPHHAAGSTRRPGSDLADPGHLRAHRRSRRAHPILHRPGLEDDLGCRRSRT